MAGSINMNKMNANKFNQRSSSTDSKFIFPFHLTNVFV